MIVYLPSFMQPRTLWLQASTLLFGARNSARSSATSPVAHGSAGVQLAAAASERWLSAADAHADCCVLPPAHRFQIFELTREGRVTGFDM